MKGAEVTRMKSVAIVALLAMLTALACASEPGEGKDSPYSDPPPGHKLAQIKLDMNDNDVRRILGDPDNSNAYQTGKAWIPYYYGPDTARSDWMYKGMGRVVFSRNRYTGGLKVIRVLYNPNEP